MTRLISAIGMVLASGAMAVAAEPKIVDGLNRFSNSLYQHAAKSGGNLVLSPYSVSAALSMALAGARGETAAQMRQVLGQAQADPQYAAAFSDLVTGILKAANTGGNELLAANSLWVQKGFAILPGFTGQLDSAFHAGPSLVDFRGNPDAARQEINAWTDRSTHGKIHELFAPGALNPDTRLVLASAVYFNGKWEHPFARNETRPAPFTKEDGTADQVPFMNRTGRFGYAETAGGQTLEIRYGGTGLAFDILLPKKGDAVEKVDPSLPGWLGGIQERPVKASIPRFRVSFEMGLAPTLESMGMRTAFTDNADFSGIDDKRDLKISKAVHKAWVDVTEEGTEAAAATGLGVAMVAMRMTEEPVFRADRPFVFVIRDTKSGLVLFIGRVLNPGR